MLLDALWNRGSLVLYVFLASQPTSGTGLFAPLLPYTAGVLGSGSLPALRQTLL